MAKRIFELPRLDQLTKEQRKVLRLPADGRFLVIGAPGTGKSVVALMRLQALSHIGNTHFLTFNHVLNHANQHLVDDHNKYSMHTAMSWFYSLHWHTCRKYMPEKEDYQPNYEAAVNNLKACGYQLKGHSLIIDEGQDLPPAWYDAVQSLGVRNFFVVADQNQRITEYNSSRPDLEDTLTVEEHEVIELKENWRNTTPIATFSSYFYTDKASPKPTIPNRPSADIPILYEYDMLDKAKNQILMEYDFDPSKLIGVFVATDAKREDWIRRLAKDNEKRSNPPPIISTYSASQKGEVNIDFGQGGIVVLNDMSVKGIEFDTVFIQTDGYTDKSGTEESLKKRMYVMCSRAREKLYLLKSEKFNNTLEAILPKENEVIKFIPEGETEEIELEILKRRKL